MEHDLKPRTVLFLTLLAVAPAGCQKQANAGASRQSAGSNAINPSAPPARPAVDPAAEVFVRDLYAHYSTATSDFSPLFQPDAGKYFSSGILALKRADEKRTPKGDEGAIGADPICACQDYDGLTLKSLALMRAGGGCGSFGAEAIAFV